ELSAFHLAANGQWREAAAILGNLLPHVEGSSEDMARVNLLLGNCYVQRGEIDRALKAYGEVLRVQPRSAAAHEGKGKMLLALGHREDALAEYRAALRNDDPAMALKVAELLFWRNLRQRKLAPDWTELDRLLEQSEKTLPNSTEVALLKAQVSVARGRPGEAVQAVA